MLAVDTNDLPSQAATMSTHGSVDPVPMAIAPATVVPASASMISATTVGLRRSKTRRAPSRVT